MIQRAICPPQLFLVALARDQQTWLVDRLVLIVGGASSDSGVSFGNSMSASAVLSSDKRILTRSILSVLNLPVAHSIDDAKGEGTRRSQTICWRDLNSNSKATSRALTPRQLFSGESKRPPNRDSSATEGGSGVQIRSAPAASLRTPIPSHGRRKLLAALRYLGYQQGQMTAHGFRTLASTLLNE
jgi:hypothetical protein